MTVRPVTPADLPAVRRLNEANVPAVGPWDPVRESLFLERAEAFWVAEDDPGSLSAIFVGLLHGHAYDSPNYRWFSDRHERFAYVDRIALAPSARGTGLADELYDRFEDLAMGTGVGVLCAEVNVVPPNPRSMAFHRRRGFVAVEEVRSTAGVGVVAMLEHTPGAS